MNKAKRENKGCVGSSLEDFLRDESILEEARELAVKREFAVQLQQRMLAQHMTKTLLARKMETSRPQIDRLLDSENPALTLSTMCAAVRALGLLLEVKIIDPKGRKFRTPIKSEVIKA